MGACIRSNSAPIRGDGTTSRRFFTPGEWFTALATTILSGSFFLYHMAPEVALQDSGELVTAAFTLGVPHSPGYPLWTFLAWVWSHFVVPFGNPAWRIGTFSVFTGALTVGVFTLIMTRGIRLVLDSINGMNATSSAACTGGRISSLGSGTQPFPPRNSADSRWIALAAGASAALLFGFTRGVWLWAGVSEMRILSVFTFMLIGCFMMIWICNPRRRRYLYFSLLSLGLGTANHMTVLVMLLPIGAGVLAVGINNLLAARRDGTPGPLHKRISFFGETIELAGAGAIVLAVCLPVLAWLRTTVPGNSIAGPLLNAGLLAALAALAILAGGAASGAWRARRIVACAAVFLAGLSFYAYMPLASSTNPPMNWGYASTAEGFYHSISRAQYEQPKLADLANPEFPVKIGVFARQLAGQYSLPLVLAAFLPFALLGWMLRSASGHRRLLFYGLIVSGLLLCLFVIVVASVPVTPVPILISLWAAAAAFISCVFLAVWTRFDPPARAWLTFTIMAFLAASLGLLALINPRIDRQEQEITMKFFAPAHGFYAMFIGLASAATLTFLGHYSRVVTRVACVLGFLLPLVTYHRNHPLCSLRDHDYGYKFGYLMFNPGGGYEPMEKNAILFGGTDPGRFVPTYMIFCESLVPARHKFSDKSFDRSDVYIITQNALADAMYMHYIRDHYDVARPANKTAIQRLLGRDRTFPAEPLRIPDREIAARAFQQYVESAVNSRGAGAVKIENGRVSVHGPEEVMAINGLLARWIFDQNKEKHAFYVEESYPIPWMYPHLRPSGIIMRLEKDPLPSPAENPALWKQIAEKDRIYWEGLTSEFTGRPDFAGNNDARKSFSKLRTAIANLYTFRNMLPEASHAFEQALTLYPESPEATFRYACLLMSTRRFDEARKLVARYVKVDEYNTSASNYLAMIDNVMRDDARRVELEKQLADGKPVPVGTALELAAIYQRTGMTQLFDQLAGQILGMTNAPPDVYLAVAQLYRNVSRADKTVVALKKYVDLAPANWQMQIELAAGRLQLNQPRDAMASLRSAAVYGGQNAIDRLRQDRRFTPLASSAEFLALFNTPAQAFPGVFKEKGP